MKKNNTAGVVVATIGTIGIASLFAVATLASKSLKKNLINDLNNFNFKDLTSSFKKSSSCCQGACTNDNFDEVLRYRKNRYYQKNGLY